MTQVATLAADGPPEARTILVQGSATSALVAAMEGRWGNEIRFDSSLSGDGKRLVTLTGAAAHKGLALATACAELGIEPAQVVAFGDSDNDLELFRAAGASVAMGQASAEVKRAATHVTVAGSEDGVAVSIGHLLATGDPGGAR